MVRYSESSLVGNSKKLLPGFGVLTLCCRDTRPTNKKPGCLNLVQLGQRSFLSELSEALAG